MNMDMDVSTSTPIYDDIPIPTPNTNGLPDNEAIFLPTIKLNKTLDGESHKFTLLPMEGDNNKFFCTDNNKYIVIYEIKYEVNGHIINQAEMPMYISDGRTNFFRMNFLLPILCIAENKKGYDESGSTFCPILNSDNIYKPGLLLKLVLRPNLNFIQLHADIISEIFRRPPFKNIDERGRPWNEEGWNYLHHNNRKIYNSWYGLPTGIFSVLRRFQTILSFLISIASFRLHETQTMTELNSLKLSRPFKEYRENVDNYNEFDFDFVNANNMWNYKLENYDQLNEYFKLAFKQGSDRILSPIESKRAGERANIFRRKFRNKLYEKMTNLHKSIFHNDTNIQLANLEYNYISFTDFERVPANVINERIKICDSKFNSIDRVANDNNIELQKLNHLIYEFITNKINNLNPSHPFKGYIRVPQMTERELRLSLYKNVKGWNATCKYSDVKTKAEKRPPDLPIPTDVKRPEKRIRGDSTKGGSLYKINYTNI